MPTQGNQRVTPDAGLVGDGRRLHDVLLELRRSVGEPSLRKINSGCGVSVGHLSEIFAGKTAPGPDVAVRIAQALKATDRQQARVRFLAEGAEADRSVRRAGDHRRTRRPGWDECPYLGLAPFEERHARIFYGRRALTRRLLDRLGERPADSGVLLVLGPSGAGKSSLLRAGLMGSLAADLPVPGCRSWPRKVLTPTADPLRQLAIHLADLAGADAISTHRALREHPEQAHLLVEQVTAAHPAGSRLVLVIDQLEELFTLSADPAEQQRFLTALHSVATSSAWVVAGIRGDFLDQATAFPHLRQAAEAGVIAVPAMSESELREAITGPAAEAGVPVPDDLVTAILDDLRERALPTGYDSGALPLLSQVMFVMWQARPDGRLTVADYHRTGGVADIVRVSADRVHDALDADRQELARRVFLHLTKVTDGRLTRRPATRDALRTVTGDDRTDLIVETFADQRLLTVSGNGLVTIVHEELLRSWTRLRDWLQPSLTDQALHGALADDVHTWLHHDRDPSYLYRGGRLHAVGDAVRRWTADPAQGFPVDPVTSDFLHAGRRRDRRRRRTYQALAAAMTALVVLAGAAAVIAARDARSAGRQHRLALAGQLAALSGSSSTTDRATAEQFAAAAIHTAETHDTIDAAGALLADHRRVIPAHLGVAAFSPDGMLATAGADGTVRLWDPRLGEPVGPPIRTHTGTLTEILFGGHGTRFVTVGEAGSQLWDTSTRRPVGAGLGRTASLLFSTTSARLATSGSDGTVRLWDSGTGLPVGEPLPGSTDSPAMEFGGRVPLLATGNRRNSVQLWDARTGQPLGEPLAAGPGPALSITFSPDGSQLAVRGRDGLVRLWDPRNHRLVGRPLAASAVPDAAVVFSPDSKLLALGGDDGTVGLWHADTAQSAGRLPIGQSTVENVVFSPVGHLLAIAGDDSTVTLWHADTARRAGRLSTGSAGEVVFSGDGERLATLDGITETVRLWDPRTARAIGGPLAGQASRKMFSPDGSLLATVGDFDGAVRLWDARSALPADEFDLSRRPGSVFRIDGKHLGFVGLNGLTDAIQVWNLPGRAPARLPAHEGVVLALNSDGTLMATGEMDGTVRVWRTLTGQPVGRPITADAEQVSFSPDGSLLAVSDGDGVIRVWETHTGRPVGAPIVGDHGQAAAMALGPAPGTASPTILATGASDGTVRLWNPRTGQPVGGPMRANKWSITDLLFSPTGDRLAAVSRGGTHATAWLWDPRTGRPVGPALAAPDGLALAVTFTPTGDLLAAVGGLNLPVVRVWNLRTGHAVAGPMTLDNRMTIGGFSPDARTLVTANVDGAGVARVWDLGVFQNSLARLCERAGNPDPSAWRSSVPGEPVAKPCA
jgi:WD40 repeat protein/transcriptional regulator with XRE-family HTH domain